MRDAETFLAQLGQPLKSAAAENPVAPSIHPTSALEAVWDQDFLEPFDGQAAQTADFQQALQATALRVLSVREHGDLELLAKLRKKFQTPDSLAHFGLDAAALEEHLQTALAECQTQNWQSNARYLEQLVSSLLEKGQGPNKIRQKARQNCSQFSLLDDYLPDNSRDWLQRIQAALDKKYGPTTSRLSASEQAKRMRFLQSRGYQPELIWRMFR
ncbi:MAG: regulatory protein RecX [Thiotrichales bacterium]|nr:regulatory protein RecX [Thiotrichales bacterium]